jgi:3-hydroxyacyl-[acyl-carrier-protein] dehydratase
VGARSESRARHGDEGEHQRRVDRLGQHQQHGQDGDDGGALPGQTAFGEQRLGDRRGEGQTERRRQSVGGCRGPELQGDRGESQEGQRPAQDLAAPQGPQDQERCRQEIGDPRPVEQDDGTIVEGAQKPGYMVASLDPPLVAWLSLPKGWQKGKTYPVFCGAEGAGCGFRGYFDAAVGSRGSRAAIVVVPCGFTNTNALDAAKYPFYDPSVLKAWDSRRMDFDGPGMDRVLELDKGRRIKAIKNVTINEDFFNGHFPKRPVMPGVLMIEALAQASALLAFESLDTDPDPNTVYYFAGIDNARFKRPVEPGDQLVLEATLERAKSSVYKFKARALVGDELAVEADLMCTMRSFA